MAVLKQKSVWSKLRVSLSMYRKIYDRIKNTKIFIFVLLLAICVSPVVYLLLSRVKLSDESIIFCHILENIIKRDVKRVKLDRLTWFEWDKVCIYGPYRGPAYDWTLHKSMWTLVFHLKNDSELPIAIERGLVRPIYPDKVCFGPEIYVAFSKEIKKYKGKTYEVNFIYFDKQ